MSWRDARRLPQAAQEELRRRAVVLVGEGRSQGEVARLLHQHWPARNPARSDHVWAGFSYSGQRSELEVDSRAASAGATRNHERQSGDPLGPLALVMCRPRLKVSYCTTAERMAAELGGTIAQRVTGSGSKPRSESIPHQCPPPVTPMSPGSNRY